MYPAPDIIFPNSYELDSLPFIKQDRYELSPLLTWDLFQAIRNLTHKHSNIFSEIYMFAPKSSKQKNS